jgi:hypothetical protein
LPAAREKNTLIIEHYSVIDNCAVYTYEESSRRLNNVAITINGITRLPLPVYLVHEVGFD